MRRHDRSRDFGWPGSEAAFHAATSLLGNRIKMALAGQRPAVVGYVLAECTGTFLGSCLPVEIQAELLDIHVEAAKGHAALQTKATLAEVERQQGTLQ